MTQWMSLVTVRGRMKAWLAVPDGEPDGGIVIAHDVFGVDEDMRRIAWRYANAGYLAIVPALFDGIWGETELAYTPENHELGMSLATRLGNQAAVEMAAAATDAVRPAGDIAVLGYGWGGMVALHAARALTIPCVNYCGDAEPLIRNASLSRPTLFHYGVKDPKYDPDGFPLDGQAPPGTKVHAYFAGDGFHREGDPTRFHAMSASLAQERSMEFLSVHLRHQYD